ncbi:MAG: hypothetical protein R3B72_41805 [Polyangiaceae bacterium]
MTLTRPRKLARKGLRATALVGLFGLLACDAILGIEDAELDDTIGADPCVLYCEQIDTLCGDDFKQYNNVSNCQKVCATFAPGSDDEADGLNTLACRQRRLDQLEAVGEKSKSCAAAGPTGDGGDIVCGTTCESFCALLFAAQCDAGSDGIPGFYVDNDVEDEAACLDECTLVNDVSPSGATHFNLTTSGVTSEDSIFCRTYHLCQAYESKQPHCLHAVGDGECPP